MSEDVKCKWCGCKQKTDDDEVFICVVCNALNINSKEIEQ